MEKSNLELKIVFKGSIEHKRGPSFAGPPKAKYGNSICPKELNSQQELLTGWLQEAVQLGFATFPVESGFPRNLYLKKESKWYEARLTNRAKGEYKGWPVEEHEVPKPFLESMESSAE